MGQVIPTGRFRFLISYKGMRDARFPVRQKAMLAAAIEPLESRRLLTTIVVNTPQDAVYAGTNTGLISLRDAVTTANSSSTATTIVISPSAFPAGETNDKTLLLINGVLELKNSKAAITITGPASGTFAISGNGQSGIFLVDAGVTADISDLNLTDGTGVYEPGVGNAAGYYGGAVYSSGNTNIANTSIVSNSAYVGGGVVNAGVGEMVLSDDYIANNTAQIPYTPASFFPAGGGVASLGGTLAMVNDTVAFNTVNVTNYAFNSSGNNAGEIGGGISLNSTQTRLSDLTVVDNKTTVGAAIQAYFGTVTSGGIEVTGSTVTLANSIIADNLENGSANDLLTGIAYNSLGGNLVGDATGTTGFGSTDLTGTSSEPLNPYLAAAAANNGGPTETVLPLSGSPAIDAGNNLLIPSGVTTDQRGYTRIVNKVVDIGAVEVQPTISVVSPTTTPTPTLNVSSSVELGSFSTPNGTAPYTVNVFWGDGSQPTTFTTSATGTIPAQSHTFATAGNVTVTVSVSDDSTTSFDSYSVFVSGGTRIVGGIFQDVNGNGELESNDPPIAGVRVYQDVNNNGVFDAGEPNAISDGNGLYQLYLGASGTATIRQVVPNGDAQEAPASNGGITVPLSPNSQIVNNSNDFIDAASSNTESGTFIELSGEVINQTLFGPNQPGLPGAEVYDDVNDNGKYDAGEPLATTDSSGDYALLLPLAGTAHLRQLVPVGFTQSSPTAGTGYDETLSSPQKTTGLNFDDYYSGADIGQFIGTASTNAVGTYGNLGNTVSNVVDGNTNTYFDAPNPNGNYVQLDLGSAQPITEIAYAPRVTSGGVDYEARMIGGYFEASNDPTFATGNVALYQITSEPSDGLTTQSVSASGSYRYVRYISPSGSYGDIAELQVFGPGGTTPVTAPVSISAFTVDNGSAQRSMVRSLKFAFNEPVTLGTGAITLSKVSGGSSTPVTYTTSTSDGGMTYVVTPTSGTTNGSLTDGSYTLAVTPGEVYALSDPSVTMTGAAQTYSFFRLFGDSNGDGTVNLIDYRAFASSYLKSNGNTGYNFAFDTNNDGTINLVDYRAFALNYLKTITA